MTNSNIINSEPLVSVLISTYNRPLYVGEAVESILRQTYKNFEIILVRDGGCEIGDVIRRYQDPRLHFIDRSHNRGLPFSFNEALSRARGEYICYLGDDDIFYPHHIETLVRALEGQDKCQVAYSDLYKSHCRIMEDGRRIVLSKNVEVSRDFDRLVMLQFNHVLHVSLMHRRDLIDKIGYYNEKLNVLIDWDLTRKLVFFTDFLHVYEVTGEFYAAIENSDRISIVRRKNVTDYLRNVLTIRSTRPPKPWPKIEDLSLIVLADRLNNEVLKCLGNIWSRTFYPYQIYLPLPKEDISQLKTVVPNIMGVPVSATSSSTERVDAALNCSDGDFVAIVPSKFDIESTDLAWLEKSLWPLIQNYNPRQAFEIVGSGEDCWGAVFRREQLQMARRNFRHLPIRESVLASGIDLRKPEYDEYPYQMDNLIGALEDYEKQSSWLEASQLCEYMYEHYDNEIWMKTRCANALYYAGKYKRAADMAAELNNIRPTPATLLIEARARKEIEDYSLAIKLYQKAQNIMDGNVFKSLTVGHFDSLTV